MLGKSIEHLLTTTTAINAIIGGRVYPISSNAEALPSIYYIVSIVPHYNDNGQQMNDWNVQLLTMCRDYAEAWQLAALIKQAFHSKRRREVDGIKYIECRCTLIRDDYEFQVGSFGHIIEISIRTANLI